MLIFLIFFLRQPVTILGELVPHEMFSQTSGLNILLKICLYTVGFPRRKTMIDSSWGVYFWGKSCLLWLPFPFMEFSVYGKKYARILATIFLPIFLFALLPSNRFNFVRLFQTIRSNYNYWNAFANRKRKNYMWKLLYPNYKKQYCTSQEKMFSWNTVLYSMSQFLHKITKGSELPCC